MSEDAEKLRNFYEILQSRHFQTLDHEQHKKCPVVLRLWVCGCLPLARWKGLRGHFLSTQAGNVFPAAQSAAGSGTFRGTCKFAGLLKPTCCSWHTSRLTLIVAQRICLLRRSSVPPATFRTCSIWSWGLAPRPAAARGFLEVHLQERCGAYLETLGSFAMSSSLTGAVGLFGLPASPSTCGQGCPTFSCHPQDLSLPQPSRCAACVMHRGWRPPFAAHGFKPCPSPAQSLSRGWPLRPLSPETSSGGGRRGASWGCQAQSQSL